MVLQTEKARQNSKIMWQPDRQAYLELPREGKWGLIQKDFASTYSRARHTEEEL